MTAPGALVPRAVARRLLAALIAVAIVVGTAGPVSAVVGRPVTVPDPSPRVRITGSGWGHGVGMSQYGARAQAQAGWGVGRILRHWYRGVQVTTTTASQRPVTVGLAVRKAPNVRVAEGVGRWVACTPGCAPVPASGGGPLRQRVTDGPWTVVATAGTLSLRAGANVLWSTRAPASLRLRLSPGDGRRDVAVVSGRRYRWGALEFGQWPGAACSGRRVCVNARVPSVEHYLRGLAEMPASWERAALRAQAVVGRTFALRRRAAGLRTTCRCHLGATAADQVYIGLDKEEGAAGDRWTAAVRATAGRVVRHDGALAATYYSSSHGGRSERVSDSYAFSAPLRSFPYLRSVADPWSARPGAGNPYARWTATVGNRRFAAFVDRRLRRVLRVEVRSRTAGTTPRQLRVTGLDRSGKVVTVGFPGGGAGSGRAAIAGAVLKPRFDLRSQQIRRIGLAPFVDDDGSPHEYALVALAAADVFDGCAARRSCHRAGLRRGQAADLLARALRLPASGRDRFVDDEGTPYEAAIDAVAAAGIVRGCARRRFCPDRVLRRDQLASLLARAFELRRARDAFVDDEGSPHERNINRLAGAGIAVGAVNRRFRPRQRVTVGQMATFLVRGLETVSGG